MAPHEVPTPSNHAKQVVLKASSPRPNFLECDVALSLCQLGRVSPDCPSESGTLNQSANSTFPPPMAPYPMYANSSFPPMPSLPPLSLPITNSTKTNSVTKARTAPKKYTQKPKDPRRDTAVSFEEMKRLMRVYGSLKCLRNRTPSGNSTKNESIKRKFYRWFPDFDERFEKTSEGWFRPKFGHEAEMAYREESRRMDQEALVRKRNSKRLKAAAEKSSQNSS
mmetsp:Transcript_7449/g.15940  ORF Transcript_7449/g.15940 Transcript_7449/m.15940 type:complete len:223 (-) Transcript_7449:180-848(-)|eukprot:CAMPEP_0171330044 /NCGR_PEP_ID=MMETSP0878-20121228/1720_1 /TAXON_ID=67004 /ORGANISM="Thalassiosira weissflogii, Strain CCMP1336" /LENGTH=222 /DNA_ID=CAMNT_0011830225 /DNA_START=73 /DNA_END=741 /DNA_ORIENTATION=+